MTARISVIVLTIVACITSAMAQPLADRAPANAVVYFGWQGIDALPPGYDQTHLKAVLDNSRMREFLTEFVPQALNKLSQNAPQAAGPIAMARMLSGQLLSHPTAFWFAGMDNTNPRQPMPKFALICHAGAADARRIEQQLAGLLAGAPQLPMRVAVVGDGIVVVSVGYPNAADAIAANPVASLAQSPAFAAAMKQVPGANSMVASYLDVEALLAMFEPMLGRGAPPQAQAMIPKIINMLGLRGIKRVIGTSGFDGKDWVSQSFIEMPMPRTGLLADMFNTPPIGPEILRAIPGDSTFVAAGRFDPAKLVPGIRNATGQIDPEAQAIVNQGMGIFQAALGVDPQTEILEPMGDQWAAYCSPSVAGNGILGMVIVNRLDDADIAQTSFPLAWSNLNRFSGAMLGRGGIQIAARTTEIDGMKVNYVGAPIVAPAWTIRDGNLYMGLYPQSTVAGARWISRGASRGAAASRSIAQNEKFMALQTRLGVQNPVGFSFYDLPVTAAQGSIYQQWLVLARYAGFGDVFGIPLPEPLLPPLDVLQEHVTPAGSFAWVDAAGYHVKGIAPFPGARMLSEPGMMSMAGVGGSAMAVSILLPSLNRARETANRVKCAANMKAMGQALLLHANENRGQYPATMGELLKQDITMEVFTCPSTDNAVPQMVRTGNLDMKMNWVNDNSNYVYLGAGKTSAVGADVIIIYEKPDDHGGQGINMLYGDGHVDFQLMPQAMEMVQRQLQGVPLRGRGRGAPRGRGL